MSRNTKMKSQKEATTTYWFATPTGWLTSKNLVQLKLDMKKYKSKTGEIRVVEALIYNNDDLLILNAHTIAVVPNN